LDKKQKNEIRIKNLEKKRREKKILKRIDKELRGLFLKKVMQLYYVLGF